MPAPQIVIREWGQALCGHVGAAVLEATPRLELAGGGSFALEEEALALDGRVGDGDGGEETLSVDVTRVVEDVGGAPLLDDAAQVHDQDPVAEMAHRAEVVGDEEIGHVQLALQAP